MDITFVGLLTNFGFAGVTLFLILTGMLVPKWVVDRADRENDALKRALDIERQRNAELASTTGTTARLVEALTDIASERRNSRGAAARTARKGLEQQGAGE